MNCEWMKCFAFMISKYQPTIFTGNMLYNFELTALRGFRTWHIFRTVFSPILLGAVFYALTVYWVICPDRYSDSSNFTLFPVAKFIPHYYNIRYICFSLTVKWYMPIEEVCTWGKPVTPDVTNPSSSFDLIWTQDLQQLQNLKALTN